MLTPDRPPGRCPPDWKRANAHAPKARWGYLVERYPPLKPSGPHAVAEPKFLLPVVVLPEPLLGEDVMDKLINELLLLTCMGTFVASATYAVTLLH